MENIRISAKENYKNISDGISYEVPFVKRSSAKQLKKTLAFDYGKIKKAYNKASRLEKSAGDRGMPLYYEWLCDNFYIISEEYYNALKALSLQKKLQSDGKNPRFFVMAKKYIQRIQEPLCEESVEVFMRSCDEKSCDSMSFNDIFSIPLLLKCALISYTADICGEFFDGKSIFDPEAVRRSLSSVITSLRYVAVHRFDKSIDLCPMEQILLSDPSGEYGKMTEDTKAYYRYLIAYGAKKGKIPERQYAKKILEKAQNCTDSGKKHIGFYLDEKKKSGTLYFFLLFFLTAGVSYLIAGFSYFFPIVLFPVWESVKLFLDFVFSKFVKVPPVLKMDIRKVPDNAKTLCVITTLLCSEKHDKLIFDKLERIFHACGGENVYFGVLCDLCDSDSATKSSDSVITKYADDRINALNMKYGKNFYLFLRNRSYSKSEKTFLAYERKRGAVGELVKLLKNKPSSFDFSYESVSDIKDLSDIKYIITLDEDTNLSIGSILKMTGAMIHPKNRPVIDGKRKVVTEGYGMMQPKMGTELTCAFSNPFTRMMCGAGGLDIYSSASFDLYQSVFSSGTFCGKGIFDKDAFFEVILNNNSFPDDSILSHDILEGERLRTALICDMELTDSFPKNEISYLKRNHRWIRGDVQNLSFLKPVLKDRFSEKYKNNFSALSRFKIFDNVRRESVCVFSLALIILSCFCRFYFAYALMFAALMPYIIPFLLESISLLSRFDFKSAARRFFTKGVSAGIWQSFTRMLFLISMLAKSAFITLNAMLLSFTRMLFTKKHMLQWVTAAMSDSSGKGIFFFIQKNIFSAILGFVLFCFAPYGGQKVLGFMFFIIPLCAYFTSFDFSGKKTQIQDSTKKQLEKYACDIWKFFKDTVNESENHLPPDNIQLFPAYTTAHRTSPTNIGLYLTGVLCARDFRFINTAELYTRLYKTISVIETLPKWHGHLYNWYNTLSCRVLSPEYISSVDTGNFIACLITLKEGLSDYINEEVRLIELIKRIEKIIDNTDFECIYNRKRELFSIGVYFDENKNAKMSDGCYDLFMSEARTLSYIACSLRKVDIRHWQKLGRMLITSSGYIGLSSWTGTAFEYFMPPIFLPVYKGSLSYEAAGYAFLAQCERYAKNKVFGISESAYFSFDSNMNYAYKAFGIPKLGLKRGLEDDLVISPYSSYIAMCVNIRKPLLNLSKLSKLGMYGRYGFYEACDFTKSRTKDEYKIVKSYMSHHMGMSLASLDNACFGNLMQKRFMHDAKISCGYELLEEKIPVNAVIKKAAKTFTVQEKPQRNIYSEEKIYTDVFLDNPKMFSLSDGSLTALMSDCGHFSLMFKDIMPLQSSNELFFAGNNFSSFIKLSGEQYAQTPLCAKNDDLAYSFSASGGKFVSKEEKYTNGKKDFSAKTEFTISKCAFQSFRIKFSCVQNLQNAKSGFLEYCAVFYPQLCTKRDFDAHPSFSSLFIEAFWDDENKILFYKRRPRGSDKERVMAAAFFDMSREFSFDTRKQDVFNPKSHEKILGNIFSVPPQFSLGACIDPICVLKTHIPYTKNGFENELILSFADSIDNAREEILLQRNVSFEKCCEVQNEVTSQLLCACGVMPYMQNSAQTEMLSAVFFGKNQKYMPLANETCSVKTLWKYGISGDFPIFTFVLSSVFLCRVLENYLRIYRLLAMENIFCDFVILYSETEKYFRIAETKIFETIRKCGLAEYVNKKNGGIFMLERESVKDDTECILSFSRKITNIVSEKYAEQKKEGSVKYFPIVYTSGQKSEKNCPEDAFKVYGGYFFGQEFCVTKEDDIRLPFSHMLSGNNISSLVTQNSFGYTFLGNASEKRITFFKGDIADEFGGEIIYIEKNGKFYDAAACSCKTVFGKGYAEYFGNIDGLLYKITVFCAENLPYKMYKLKFAEKRKDNFKVYFSLYPIMGKSIDDGKNVKCFVKDKTVFFKNNLSETMSKKTGFAYGFCPGGEFGKISFDTKNVFLNCSSEEYDRIYIMFENKDECCFVFGGSEKFEVYEKVFEKTVNDKDGGFSDEKIFAGKFIPEIACSFKNKDDVTNSFEYMFNFFLPYQNAFSRFIGRSGFYQSGGAYGFRDQLQDALALMYSDRERARNHIYRCAFHQFEKGDVLHWWHNISENQQSVHRGVRTKCSDDCLFLPYAVSCYCEYTGDTLFLDKSIFYIKGPELSENETEKYFSPQKSDVRESLYFHSVRAVEYVLSRFGAHGIPLIGSCDWCDGFSNIGVGGKGESVWLGMFLKLVLDKFSRVCEIKKDINRAKTYRSIAKVLKKNIIDNCYDKDSGYFIRGFYDDGEKLGSADSEECKIDILPQCFSAISSVYDNISIAESSLLNAYSKLFDEEYKILKLFSPPFSDGKKNPGYVKGYVSGLRENGGQYTHAAIWGAYGYFCMASSEKKLGRINKASEFLRCGEQILLYSNPAFRCSFSCDKNIREAYFAEPYCIAADIYSNAENRGRAGWTQYTGAAGWYYRTMLEKFFGIFLSEIESEHAKIVFSKDTAYPFPERLDGSTVNIRIGKSEYKILYFISDSEMAEFDEKECSGFEIPVIPGKHEVKIYYRKI